MWGFHSNHFDQDLANFIIAAYASSGYLTQIWSWIIFLPPFWVCHTVLNPPLHKQTEVCTYPTDLSEKLIS